MLEGLVKGHCPAPAIPCTFVLSNILNPRQGRNKGSKTIQCSVPRTEQDFARQWLTQKQTQEKRLSIREGLGNDRLEGKNMGQQGEE